MINKIKKLINDKNGGMGLRPTWVTVFLIGLFMVSLITFATSYISLNNPSTNIYNNPSLNTSIVFVNNTQATLAQFGNTVNQTYSAVTSPSTFVSSSISIFLILDTFISAPVTLLSYFIQLMNLIGSFMFSTLFDKNMNFVYGTIFGILLGSIVFMFVKLGRIGETER